MPIIPGVHASANKFGAIVYNMTLKSTSTNAVIYETDVLATMVSFIQSYSAAGNITAPTTLMFNTSFAHNITSPVAFNFANGANLFTVKAATGTYPLIRGNDTIPSIVVNSMSNLMWDGISCSNSDITDPSGCLIRNNSSTINTTYQNLTLKRGYCAIRATGVQDASGNATSIIEKLTVKNCTVEDTINGSFRFGNGDVGTIPGQTNFSVRTSAYYDMKNVVVQNIKLVDNFNKGPITDSTQGFSGILILKKILGLVVDNVTCTNTSEGLLSIESSANVSLDKVLAENFGFKGVINQQGLSVVNTIGITVKNIFMRPNNDTVGKTIMYCDNVKGLELYHNSCIFVNNNDVPFYANNMALLKMAGGLFKSSGSQNPCVILFTNANGYVPTIAQDLLLETGNVFCSGGTYNVNLEITERPQTVSSIDILVQVNTTGSKISPATYRSTYNLGANTLFPTDTEVSVSSRVNPNSTISPAFYLNDASVGRNSVPSQVGGVTTDVFGFIRTFPTDAGACDRDAVVLA